MEKDQNQQNLSTPSLCQKCQTFYANPQFGSFCSKCYKETPSTAPLQEKPKNEESGANAGAQQNPSTPVVEQQDHEICWGCKKRVGMRGYTCKCGYTYCKKHRLPESHECEFDYINEGKMMLAKDNPNLKPEKMEKI